MYRSASSCAALRSLGVLYTSQQTPDQCHGGVLTAGIQSLLMQTDGRKIYLLPAFPAKWNADFKLHAPHNTVIECRVENGMVTSLTVTPEERRKDVILCEPFTF